MSAATGKPAVTPVQPIVSAPTDLGAAMPAGHPGASAPVAVPSTLGRGRPVATPPVMPSVQAVTPPSAHLVEGFVPGRSVEKVAARTDRSTTFDNPDGSHTTQISNRPTRFRGPNGWTDIDDTVVADPAHAGGFRNRATPSWPASSRSRRE